MEDDETTNDDQDNFGTTVAKSFIINVAAAAGMMAGLYGIGFTLKKIEERREARATKKTEEK